MSYESNSSLAEQIFSYLKENGGRSRPGQICREVLGLANCDDEIARMILSDGLMRDSRFRVLRNGEVVLNRAVKSDPDIASLRYAVIDIETTGLPSADHRVTEIAIIFINEGDLVDRFSTLINPGMPIPPRITEITGITEEMVADAPSFDELAESLLEMLDDRVLVAHNSAFDVNFINAELNRVLGIRLANRALCTVRLSRALLPGLDSHTLDSVAHYFGIEIENRHRALGDADATAQVFLRLCDKARERNWIKLSRLMRVAGLRASRFDVASEPEYPDDIVESEK